MSDVEYYNRLEVLLEQQIKQIKKVYFLPNKEVAIRSLSELVDKTRELKNGTSKS